MNRKIKALGLALVAALAMSAMVASAAQAGEFHSAASHTILHGEQEGTHVFTVGEGFGNITCTTATFEGAQTSSTASSQTITPKYSGCKDSLGERTTHVTGGKFTFTPPSTATGDAQVHIIEPFTLDITPENGFSTCHVQIDNQTVNGLVYHNSSGKVQVTTKSTGITSTVLSGGFFNCGTTNGLKHGGTYTGNTLMAGSNTEGKAVAISVTP